MIKVKLELVFNLFEDVLKILFEKVIIILGILVSWIYVATGGRDKYIECLLIVMGIDFITGIIKSVIKNTTSSKTGKKGIGGKFIMLCIVALAYLLDIIMDINTSLYNCRIVVISFYFVNEGISILENAVEIGLPVPEQLKNMLEQCKKRDIKREK